MLSGLYPDKVGCCVFYHYAVLWCVQIIECIMTRWSYSFVCMSHYRLITIIQTYLKVLELLKCLSGKFCLKYMYKIKSILLIILNAIYGAVRIQCTHFSWNDCENMCTLSYYHHQIGNMTHLSLFSVRSWNNGMRCMYFYILIGRTYCGILNAANIPALYEIMEAIFLESHP